MESTNCLVIVLKTFLKHLLRIMFMRSNWIAMLWSKPSAIRSLQTSNDELRLAMTGVLMQMDFNKVIFVSTDAHKLVKYTIGGLNSELTESIIIPKKCLTVFRNALQALMMIRPK